jgi:hypothetical protein
MNNYPSREDFDPYFFDPMAEAEDRAYSDDSAQDVVDDKLAEFAYDLLTNNQSALSAVSEAIGPDAWPADQMDLILKKIGLNLIGAAEHGETDDAYIGAMIRKYATPYIYRCLGIQE